MKVPTFFSRTRVPTHAQTNGTDGATGAIGLSLTPMEEAPEPMHTVGSLEEMPFEESSEMAHHTGNSEAMITYLGVYRDDMQYDSIGAHGPSDPVAAVDTMKQDATTAVATHATVADEATNDASMEPTVSVVSTSDLATLLARLRHTEVSLVNVLLSIAWLGEVHSRQVHWAWMPTYTDRSVRRVLQQCAADGLIQSRWFYRHRRSQRKRPLPPLREGKLWSLTPLGMQFIRLLPNAPLRTIKLRSLGVANHDMVTVEIVLRLVALARAAGVSGVYLDREVMLNPPARRPTMDGVIALRTTGTPVATLDIPWTTDPPTTGERVRKYAIENDRMSEEIAVLIGKAHAYQQAATPEWVARNGQFPIPLWVVPNDKRKDDIMQAWRTAWPHGKWLITTDAGLAHDRWVEYHNGHERQRSLFTLRADA